MLENESNVLEMSDDDLQKALDEEERQSQPVELETQPPVKEVAETEEIPEKVEEEVTEEKVVVGDEGDKALKGMQREIAEQRRRRREAEEQLAFLKGQLEANKLKEEPKPKPFDDLSDDELIDGGALKQVVADLEATKAELAQQRKEFNDRVAREVAIKTERSEAQMRSEYSAEKVGDAYAYDKVIAEGFMPLLQSDPAMAKRVRESANPAMEAYRIGFARVVDPISLVKQQSSVPVKPSKPAPNTLGSAPAGGGSDGEIDLATLSPSQLAKLTDKQLDMLMRKQK